MLISDFVLIICILCMLASDEVVGGGGWLSEAIAERTADPTKLLQIEY